MSPSRSDYIFTTLSAWVWRVVSEDSFNHLPNWPLSLLAFHIHLVGLSNDCNQLMRVVVLSVADRSNDFTKELKVALLAGERHIAFKERNYPGFNQTTADDTEDQYVLVA